MTRLEQMRIDHGLTAEELGAKAGVHGGTIRRIEAGKRATPGTLHKLALALVALGNDGVRASELQRPIPEPNERTAA